MLIGDSRPYVIVITWAEDAIITIISEVMCYVIVKHGSEEIMLQTIRVRGHYPEYEDCLQHNSGATREEGFIHLLGEGFYQHKIL